MAKKRTRKIKLTGDINKDLKTLLDGRKPRAFRQHVWVRPDVGLVEIFLEDCSYHAEWIKGEGADIAILRANDKTNRAVGAILPLRNYTGEFFLTDDNQELRLKEACDAARKRVSGYSPAKRAELLKRARYTTMRFSGTKHSPIPKWNKPPTDVPVQALREFMARFGPDVSVLVTWTHETSAYQFVTIGADQLYSNSAVNLRNLIAEALALKPLGPAKEDLRGDHPNVRLTDEQIQFLLWVLGRMFAEKDKLGKNHRKYIRKYHDQLLELLGNAKSILENKPT